MDALLIASDEMLIPYNTDRSKKMTGVYHQELIDTFGDLVTDPVRTDTAVPLCAIRGDHCL
jgi:hypothetical protein